MFYGIRYHGVIVEAIREGVIFSADRRRLGYALGGVDSEVLGQQLCEVSEVGVSPGTMSRS